jgi:hypothetical protein
MMEFARIPVKDVIANPPQRHETFARLPLLISKQNHPPVTGAEPRYKQWCHGTPLNFGRTFILTANLSE